MNQQSATGYVGEFKPSSRYRLLSSRELLEQPKMQWVVQDVLPTDGIAAIYGDSKNGKSFLALDVLLAIAEGQDWFGHPTKTCATTYLALEAHAGVSQRLRAYGIHRGEPSDRFKVITQNFSLVSPDDVDELANCLIQAGRRDGVLIIDTLARAAPGLDENSSKDMGQIIQGTSRLQSMVGGLVVLVHHTGKDGNKGPRGHSSLLAALDAAIRVDRKVKRRTWTVDKAKDALDGRTHGFDLEVVPLGVDARYNPVSSCVVVPTGEAGGDNKATKLPQGHNQAVVWALLQEGWASTWENGRGGAPASAPCVHLSGLIETSRDKLKVPPERVRERVQAAIKGLVEKGMMHQGDGWLWPAENPEKT